MSDPYAAPRRETPPAEARVVAAPQGALASLMTYLLLRSEYAVSLILLGPSRAVVEWRGNLYELLDHTHSTRVETLAVVADRLQGASSSSPSLAVLGGDGELRTALAKLANDRDAKIALVHLDDRGDVAALTKASRTSPLGGWLHEAARTEPADPDTLMPVALVAARRYDRALAEQDAFAQRFRSKRPVATLSVVAALLGIFALELLWGSPDSTPTLVRMGALVPDHVADGQWWRLASCASLHASVPHALVNGYALFGLGVALEKILGSSRFLLVYSASAIAGSVASYALTRGTSVGASGAIWGLMLATLTLALNTRQLLPPHTARSLRTALMRFFLLNVGISFLPGIDLWAHFGGGAVGALAIYSGLATSGLPKYSQAARMTPKASGVVRASSAAGVAVLVAGIAWAIAVGQPWRLASAGDRPVRVDVGAPLTFEVPDLLAETRTDRTLRDGSTEISFGDLNRDGAVVAVRLRSLPSVPTRDTVIQAVLRDRAALHRQIGDDLDVTRDPSLERVGQRWVLLSDFRSPGGQLWFGVASVIDGATEYEFQFAHLEESSKTYGDSRRALIESLRP